MGRKAFALSVPKKNKGEGCRPRQNPQLAKYTWPQIRNTRFIIVAQDQCIKTNYYRNKILKDGTSPMCRICEQFQETVDHLVCGCSELAQGQYIQRTNFWKKTLFLHTSLKQFLFKICTNIHHMVLNCQHKRNFDFVYKNCQYFCLNSLTDITKKSTSNFACSS